MVPEVTTGDPTKLLCLNCAQRSVVPRNMPRYGGLTSYLCYRGAFTDKVKLSFARIDGIIGENLPMDAYRNEKWWGNEHVNFRASGWLNAGWEVQEVNLKEGYVVFKKVKEIPLKRKAKTREIKPFTPVRVRIPKPKTPSKTKVSRLYARIKNIERQRTMMPKYHGSFKPRSRHEKTLFKPDEKSS
jgi:hypothetical protein